MWPPSPAAWWPATTEGPCFLADAVTDPLSGLVAAAAVLEALAAGGRWLLDVAMAPLAAAVAGPAVDVGVGVGGSGSGSGPRWQRSGRGRRRRGRSSARRRRWDRTRPPCCAAARRARAARAAGVSSLLLRDAEVDGGRVDVRVDDGLVMAVGPRGDVPGADEVIECAGGALLPGLHDHHLHLLAMAAAAESVDVSGGLDEAVRAAHAHAQPGAAIRAVHYDEVRHGPLDRWRLDALAPGRAVRVQHRSGALWVLSSVALDEVGAAEAGEAGIERDHRQRPTGRLFRLDGWLRGRLPARLPPDLAAVGRRLASYGVTGVTDCTPAAVTEYFEPIAAAVRAGALPLTVWVTGGPELSEAHPPPPLRRGPVKILITDHAFPSAR